MIKAKEIREWKLVDQLRVMELLWEEISREEENVEVPEWHKELLDERASMIEEGKARFMEWEEAKKEIRKSL